MIELLFPTIGSTIPSDHGYALYGSLSRVIPALHEENSPIRIGPIRGRYAGNGILNLERPVSALRMRLPAEQIALVLPLAGQALELDGHRIRLGVPQVRALIPATSLLARMVIIKSSSPIDPATKTRDFTAGKRTLEPTEFLAAVQRKLTSMEISATAIIPPMTTGKFAGQPRRRVMRIHSRTIVGFPLMVSGLAAKESICLQERGLGGRQKMGCSFFVPLKEDQQ